ncbi:MAG: FlgD immunoglobulin-like domain containing protein, partial [candidate division KSB1 bacterium]
SNKDDLELLWEATVNKTSKTWKKKVWGVTLYSYTVRLSNTQVTIPEQLPEIQLTVAPDGKSIDFSVSVDVHWSTHARGSNGSIHASPTFDTKLTLRGKIIIAEDERGKYVTIQEVHGQSVTDAQGDIVFTVNILNIGNVRFTWRKIDLLVQSQIDQALVQGVEQINKLDLNKDGQPDLAQRFYFESFLSNTFFDGKPMPSQQDLLDGIFAAEAPWIEQQINNGRRGAVWEIGNEPNWFPLMRPEQYAALYARYYELLKRLDPSAKCMIGGLFLKEAIDNPRDIVLTMIPVLVGPFREELATFISSGLFETGTTAWLEGFYAALPTGVKVDLGNFHLYPMQAASPVFQLAEVQPHIETLAQSFAAHGATGTWISEMGNIDWRRKTSDVALMCTQLTSYLKYNTVGINKWFWSRSMGYDHRFDTIGQQPPSALLANDGVTLTAIGQAYLTAAQREVGDDPPVELVAGASGVAKTQAALPERFALTSNYPNPFRSTQSLQTHIPFGLPEAGEVRVEIYDLLGRLTRQIMQAQHAAGWHEVTWDGRNETGALSPAGIYFYRLTVSDARGKVAFTETKRLALLR